MTEDQIKLLQQLVKNAEKTNELLANTAKVHFPEVFHPNLYLWLKEERMPT